MSGARRTVVVLLALDIGIWGDVLLRAPGAPGLNAALWAAAGVAAAACVIRGRGAAIPRESGVLLAIALVFALALAWRDAPSLRALNVLAAVAAATLAAAGAAAPWLLRAGSYECALRGVYTLLAVVSGPLLLPAEEPIALQPEWRRRGMGVLRGSLLAFPLLLVFGSLLAAADPMFEHVVTRTLAFDAAELIGHLLLISFLAWTAAGYLGRFAAPRSDDTPAPPWQRRLGFVEGAVTLTLVNALFLLFIGVQLRYLFGGSDVVQQTVGLGYADYARRGFFELVAVVALVVPLLLLVEWVLRRERPAQELGFRLLTLGQILLLYGILASALYRMHLYRQVYGLTELRLYTTAFMAWIAFVLAWLAVTVLRGRRHRFVSGALTAAFATVFLLDVANPHAVIARVNTGRAAAGDRFDAAYATALSADAVPALVASLERLPAARRCVLSHELIGKWRSERPGGWRTWNHGDWRARRSVAALAAESPRC